MQASGLADNGLWYRMYVIGPYFILGLYKNYNDDQMKMDAKASLHISSIHSIISLVRSRYCLVAIVEPSSITFQVSTVKELWYRHFWFCRHAFRVKRFVGVDFDVMGLVSFAKHWWKSCCGAISNRCAHDCRWIPQRLIAVAATSGQDDNCLMIRPTVIKSIWDFPCAIKLLDWIYLQNISALLLIQVLAHD